MERLKNVLIEVFFSKIFKKLLFFEIKFYIVQMSFQVKIEGWTIFWRIMRDENKLLSHHLAKAIKYLENIVYPLWEPRLFLMDSTPRFFFNELHNVHIKPKILSLALLSQVIEIGSLARFRWSDWLPKSPLSKTKMSFIWKNRYPKKALHAKTADIFDRNQKTRHHQNDREFSK